MITPYVELPYLKAQNYADAVHLLQVRPTLTQCRTIYDATRPVLVGCLFNRNMYTCTS